MDFNLSPLNKMVIKTAKAFCEQEIPKIDAYMKLSAPNPPYFLGTSMPSILCLAKIS